MGEMYVYQNIVLYIKTYKVNLQKLKYFFFFQLIFVFIQLNMIKVFHVT